MNVCTQCGEELGVGRFCTNCGHPVDLSRDDLDLWRTDTAERPRIVAPVEPPPAPERPAPARFPLFADDIATSDPPVQTPPPVVLPPPPPVTPDRTASRRPEPGPWLPWLVGAVVMLLIAGLGAWLLFAGGDQPDTAREAPPAASTDDQTLEEPEPSESTKPSPTKTADAPPITGDLARYSEVSAPPPAPANQDTDGNLIRYVATNLVDGIPETCWRMPGDGTGRSIRFRFEGPTTLSRVGLINGYAKVARDGGAVLDWYHGNRRVSAVEWTFDDGTLVTQRLRDTTLLQTIPVRKVETRTVTIRLLDVTLPGPGRASRNYTALSEVSLVGTTT